MYNSSPYAIGPLSCRYVLSVTLVHCSQTIARIKMNLGTQVGLCAGHIVLDGDPTPLPQKRHRTQFSAHICSGQMAAWIKMPLGMEVCLTSLQTKIRPMYVVAKRLDGSRWYTWNGGWPQPSRLCVRWGPGTLHKKGAEPHPQKK